MTAAYPEVDTLILERVMQILKVGVHELPITRVEWYRFSLLWIPAQCLADGFIRLLVRAHAVCRVEVEGRLEFAVVQIFQEGGGIREEIGVPGVTYMKIRCQHVLWIWERFHMLTRPARPILLSIDIDPMPVHVQDSHGEGNLLLGKAVHQVDVFFSMVLQKAPVSDTICFAPWCELTA